jgi:hypothetical protein
MTTASDIIAGAYQRLGLLALGADLDSDRAAAGLAVYNDMLNAWAADGIFPGGPYPPVQQSDGFCAGGDFIDGNAAMTQGGYQPYGPSDASTPPSGSALSYDLDDAFPLAPQFVEGAKALLAVELAPQSGIEPQPSLQERARKSRAALLAYYVIAPNAGQDTGLIWMPSLRRYGFR